MAELKSISIDGTSYNVDLPAITSGLKTMLLNQIYPVGSIYMSVNSSNPGTLFGGTWQRIQDRFLLACGSTYANGATGGEATHTLTENEMPTHKHLSGNVNSSVKGTTSGNQWMTLMTRAANDETSYNTNTSSVGGGAAHNNLPPYLAVYVWKRTA